MNSTSRLLAWCFVGAVGMSLGAYLLMAAASPTPEAGGYDLLTFGRLPITDHGRVKPMDTLARINLMIISGKQDYKDKGVTQPATRWLLDLMTVAYHAPDDPQTIEGESRKVKAYEIEDSGLRARLRLGDDTRFSYQDLMDAAGPVRMKDLILSADAIQAQHKDLKNPQELLAVLDGPDRDLVKLAFQIENHMRFSRIETSHRVFLITNFEVLALLGLEPRPGFRYGFDEFLPRLGDLRREGDRVRKVKEIDRTLFDRTALETYRHVEIYAGLAMGNADTLSLVAPLVKGGRFLTLAEAIEIERSLNKDDKEAQLQARIPLAFTSLLKAYASDRKQFFNKLVTMYEKEVEEMQPSDTARASTEASFNAFAPFYVCTILYVSLFLVICVSWIWPEPVINRFAFWMTILTACVHVWALGMRMYIQGRPPVTNLYSSAVFIGCICVLATIVLEWIYRNGIPLAVGTLCGALTLLIAHHLGSSGDTLEMLQAVLDTNFWLATHVTSVTIGYSATFIAGMFGVVTIVVVLAVSVMRLLGHPVEMPYHLMKLLGQCIYGIVCFALLFSFLGTVLGGIWADYSWGRFWGWDPKENGALLIVIVNALILHARWAGMVKVRGMAILSLLGAMVMMWSWFGTNQLGIGLHSYGINRTLVELCRYTWLALMGLGCLALLPLPAWNPKYTPLVRSPESAPPVPPMGKKGRRGQVMQGGAT